MNPLYLAIPLSPLGGALVAGFFGRTIGRTLSHSVTILGMIACFICSLLVLQDVLAGHLFNGPLYTWASSGGLNLEVGFLVDGLSASMAVVVSFISLMVHVYTIGYMHEDPGYQRFFCYISLFTFGMLMLVLSNNFLQLFFGWEAVGLMSYLLIGFWYTRPSAIFANLKAFLVNRVGDFGFLLGIALVAAHFGSLDYAVVFGKVPGMQNTTIEIFSGVPWDLYSVIGILLFVGAMGKSAQVPLHVWLPDSMEGPTPISALIHAATMVTAGIFMVSRLSPLYEAAPTALSVILVIGAITAFFMGLLGLVQHDIKRVVAYSTLSQLGYMTVGLGASAYAASMFHLITHAFFKALLFLAAGSVIMAMHHEQDMRRMGGLRRYLPVTYVTSLVGTLALCGFPPFAGFFSKDAIIEATRLSNTPGAGLAYAAVLSGVFITSLYSFRLLFLAFHGKPRMDEHTREHLHESPWVVTVPLVLLALASALAGWFYVEPMLYGNHFGQAIVTGPGHEVLRHMAEEFHGPAAAALEGLHSLPFWLALAGAGTAAYLYIVAPGLPGRIALALAPLHRLLVNKYYLDVFYEAVFATGARRIGRLLWTVGDIGIIDGAVNGAARAVGSAAALIRQWQSGYVYHYAFTMICGVFLLLTLWFVRG